MKRTYLKTAALALAVLASSCALRAQDAQTEPGPKGQFLIYGSLDYSKTSGRADKSSSFSTSPDAGVPLGVGYFITDNTLVGVNFAFSHKNDRDGNTTFQQQEAGLWFSPSMPLGKNFFLIGQVDAHYVWGKAPGAGLPLDPYKGFRLRAYPMLGVALGKGWALKFKFGELSVLSTRAKGEGRVNNYVAGISGATFGTGISKTISFKRSPK